MKRVWFIHYILFCFRKAPFIYTRAAFYEVAAYILRLASITSLMWMAVHILRFKQVKVPHIGLVDFENFGPLMLLGLLFTGAYSLAGLCNYLAHTVVLKAKTKQIAFIQQHDLKPNAQGRTTIFVAKAINRTFVVLVSFILMMLLSPVLGSFVAALILASSYLSRRFIQLSATKVGGGHEQDNTTILSKQRWLLVSAVVQAVTITTVFLYFLTENKSLDLSVANIVAFFFLVRTCLASVQNIFVNIQQLYLNKEFIMKELQVA